MCGRLRVGKSFLHVCSIGRCSHVFGLLVRHTRPLAIMPSADQVPIRSTHSTMRWHKWVVLIEDRPALHYVLFALPTVTSRRMADAISVTPQARPVPCSTRPWPSSPTPSARSCWPGRWRRPCSAAAPRLGFTNLISRILFSQSNGEQFPIFVFVPGLPNVSVTL
jgi:hypothetical protein